MKTTLLCVASGLTLVLGLSGCADETRPTMASTAPPTTISVEQTEFIRCVDVISTAVVTDLLTDGGGAGSGEVIRSYGTAGPEYSTYIELIGPGMKTMAYEGLGAAEVVVFDGAREACARLHPNGVVNIESPTTVAQTPEEQNNDCYLVVTEALMDTFLARTDGDPNPGDPAGSLLRLYGYDSAIFRAYRDLAGPFVLAAREGGTDAGFSSIDVAGTCAGYVSPSAADGGDTSEGAISEGPVTSPSGSPIEMRFVVESFVESWINGDYEEAELISNPSVISTIETLPAPDPNSPIDCFTDEGGFPLCGTQLLDGSLVVFEVDWGLVSSVRSWDPNLG